MSNTPSDAELAAFADAFDWDGWIAPALAKRAFARAVLAKWGAPQPVVREPQPMPDLTQLTERGAKVWAEVDAQALRDGREPQCWCLTCKPMRWEDPDSIRMALCPTCGNKRCPKANDHRNACTNSNAPGQKGSAYEECGVTQKGGKDADRPKD